MNVIFPAPLPRAELFGAAEDLETRMLPQLRAMACFREATRKEIDASFAAYQARDFPGLLRTWAEVAEPTRAAVPASMRFAYSHAGKAPKLVNASVFLLTLRTVAAASDRMPERLSPQVVHAMRHDFPWIDPSPLSVPEGESLSFDFPEPYVAYLEHGSLDDSRARWQLSTCLNEIQQASNAAYSAELFGLPELARIAERGRERAVNYLRHWAPRCTRDLWRETIYAMDAINAGLFELLCAQRPWTLLRGMFSQRAQWRSYVAQLDVPQRLLEPRA